MASNFPNGFVGGVTIRGVPLLQTHPGEVFWVNNSSTALAKGGVGGSDGNDGSYRRPFSTVDYAIGKCTAGRGDIIFVMPGYTETISAAAGWACDVAGIAIVGLGSGTNKPTLTFSATGSDINISAANVTISPGGRRSRRSGSTARAPRPSTTSCGCRSRSTAEASRR